MSASADFVFDANVVVSAALFKRSTPRQALDAALAHGHLLFSEALIEELREVLLRPGFDKYLSADERLDFLANLVDQARLVVVTEVIEACRDPKDNKLLELAVSGKATCLVSGDKDLLALHPFRSIPILTPAQFLASLAPADPSGHAPQSDKGPLSAGPPT